MMYGPTSLRRNDLRLLGASNINARLAANGDDVAFGDNIYPKLSNITTYHKTLDEDMFPLSAREKAENKAYKSVRIAIEWNYGHTANLFKYLKNLDRLRVLQGEVVSTIYTVAVILRNCRIACAECQSSEYFDIQLPPNMLERYLRFVP